MIKHLLMQTPIRVWILAAFLSWLGYQSCFTRIRSFKRLLLTPAYFLFMEVRTIDEIFKITLDSVSISLMGLLVGASLGYLVAKNRNILVDHRAKLIQIPGEYLTLTVLLLNFTFQYALHTAFSMGSDWLIHYQSLALLLLGVFCGISIGRNAVYFYKYKTGKHCDLLVNS